MNHIEVPNQSLQDVSNESEESSQSSPGSSNSPNVGSAGECHSTFAWSCNDGGCWGGAAEGLSGSDLGGSAGGGGSVVER